MKNFIKIGSALAILGVLTACGSSSSSSSSTSGSSGVVASSTGTLFGTSSSASPHEQVVRAAAAGAPLTYYIPIINTTSNTLQVSNATVSDTSGTWSVSSTSCSSLAANASCLLAVSFEGNNVASSSDLTTTVTVNYTNGTSNSFPVTGQIVSSSQSAIIAQMPQTIVPNSSGTAYGVITVFNNTATAQTINESQITPNVQSGVTWNFSPNCNGQGGSTIESYSACSIGFTYQTSASTNAQLSVAIPFINSSNTTTTIQVTGVATAPQSASNPQAYLVYSGGAVPFTGTSASFQLQNLGNGTLAGINVNDLGSGVSQTNNCSNLASNGLCTVTLSSTTNNSNSFTLTITQTGESSGVSVPVVGQNLAVSPTVINFGTNYGGAQISRQVTVTNYSSMPFGISPSISDESAYYSISSNTCSSVNLAPLSSCNFTIVYTAPNSAGSQNGSAIVNTASGESQTVSLSGASESSSWTNLTATGGYNESGSPALSLAVGSSGTTLYLGNSNPPGESGARNVWSLNGGNWTNFTESISNYEPSAVTALQVSGSGASTQVVIGQYDGAVQSCTASSCNVESANSNSLGVTSIVSPESDIYFISYANRTNGASGQILKFNLAGAHTHPEPVAGISSGVGKMATDGTYVYAPLQNGQLVKISESGTVGSNIAPSSLASGEFITVVFYAAESSGATLYAGTSLGNVYSSPTSQISTTSWTKLTSLPLATNSYISALAIDSAGTLYAGLANLSTPANGGAVFSATPNGSSTTFTQVAGYSDISSVSSIVLWDGYINVATYAGNVWQYISN